MDERLRYSLDPGLDGVLAFCVSFDIPVWGLRQKTAQGVTPGVDACRVALKGAIEKAAAFSKIRRSLGQVRKGRRGRLDAA